jgi:hypothetical protein
MKVFIKSTFTLILLVSLLTGKSFAQSKKNLHLFKIYTLDRKISRGILDSVDNNGLYLVKRIGRPRTFISANQIKTIKLRRKSKASTGTTIGFLTGLAAGTGAAIALHNDDRVENAIRTVSAVLFTFATTAVAGGNPDFGQKRRLSSIT